MLKLKLEYFGHLMQRADSLEKTLMLGKIEGRRRRGKQKTRWLDGITDSIEMILSKLWKMVKDRKAWIAAVQFGSFTQSCPTLRPHGLQHATAVCPSPTPETCSNSCPSSWWCHLNISSSVIPFSSHLQYFPASGSFPMSQFFTSGGQSIRDSASASVLPMNIQDWFPLGLAGLISMQSRELSRIFSNTTVQKHQFFAAQASSQSNSHIHTWPQEKP